MMKTLKAVVLMTVVSAAALATSGCSMAQKGAAGGGLAGGIGGAIVGNNWVSAGPATGAVVGGSSGAAIGGIAGDAFDQVNEKDMERELQNLRAELLNKDNELAQLRQAGAKPELAAQLESARKRLADLENELAMARSEGDRASTLKKDMAAMSNEAATLRKRLRDAENDKNRVSSEADNLDREAQGLRNRISAKEKAMADLQAELAAKSNALDNLKGEMQVLQTSLSGKTDEMAGLEKQLSDMNVKMEQTSRGLTLTIADSLLYDTGRAELTTDGEELVGKVATIIKERFPNNELLVEGHTDNQPIVRSGWHSNWELGAARALTLLHELVNDQSIAPGKVSAASYGEFRPASTNATADGRRQNRRAVIVILPEQIPFERKNLAQAN